MMRNRLFWFLVLSGIFSDLIFPASKIFVHSIFTQSEQQPQTTSTKTSTLNERKKTYSAKNSLVKNFLFQAYSSLKIGRHQEAMVILKKIFQDEDKRAILEKNKKLNFYWNIFTATAFEEEKQFSKAFKFYKKSWEINPKHFRAAFKLSFIAYKSQRNSEAEKYLNHALKLAPNNKAVLSLQRKIQARHIETTKNMSSIGFRGGYLSPLSGMGDHLSGGFGVNLYYNLSLDFFLGNFLCAGGHSFFHYFFHTFQVMINFENLSKDKNYLRSMGFEIGPRWSFHLARNQALAFHVLVGFVYEKASNGSVSPVLEKAGLQFSSHFILSYEVHFSDVIFSVSSYNTFSLDQDMPLPGTGLSAGVGYKIFKGG